MLFLSQNAKRLLSKHSITEYPLEVLESRMFGHSIRGNTVASIKLFDNHALSLLNVSGIFN